MRKCALRTAMDTAAPTAKTPATAAPAHQGNRHEDADETEDEDSSDILSQINDWEKKKKKKNPAM